MSDGTTYYVRVVVRDNAGNEGKSAADNANGATATTPSANTNPWFTTQAYASNRSTNSMTISAVATDNEQTSLTYTLYWNGSSSATQTKTANKGTIVTFNAINGLSEYTTYSWRVVVSDSNGGMATSSNSQKTYCPGNNSGCKGPEEKECYRCFGYGYVCPICKMGKMDLVYSGSANPCQTCRNTNVQCYGNYCPACSKNIAFKWYACPDCGTTKEPLANGGIDCSACERRIYHRDGVRTWNYI